MGDRQQARQALIIFLRAIARPGSSLDEADDHTNLIDDGLIDSLALIQIIQYLEQEYGLNLQACGIDPNDLSTVAGILAAVERATA